jgi:anti-anti-sigma factor
MTVSYLQRPPIGRSAGPSAPLSGLFFSVSDGAGRTVAVSGEVDAANAKEFAVTVGELAAGADRLTLDLTGLGFIALDGCAALHSINTQMMRAGTEWQVLPGAAVRRLLALCDRERLIPVAAVPLTLVSDHRPAAKRPA